MQRSLAVAALLACIACTHASAGAKPPALNEDAPVEQVGSDAYNLTATYDAVPRGAEISLLVDRQEDGSCYVLQVTPKRSTLTKAADGKRTKLAVGSGLGSTPDGLELTVCRRPGIIRVFAGPTLLLEAYDSQLVGGSCGSVVGPEVCAPTDVFVQELEDIEFEDEFFGGDERGGLWEALTGDLAIDIYWDPKQKRDNRPIGASWFANQTPGEHLAVSGWGFWEDYRAEVSVRPAPDSSIAVAARVRDAANYAALVLTTATDQDTVAQLVEVRDGERRVVAEASGAWPPGQWHRLRLEVLGTEACASVNGQSVGEGELDGWRWGPVGLWARTEGDCRFDDLAVHGLRAMRPEARPQPGGPWEFVSGSWTAAKNRVNCRAASTAVAVASVGEWEKCAVNASVTPSPGGEAGVLARWDGQGGYGLTVGKAGADVTWSLGHVGESPRALAEGTLTEGDGPVELSLSVVGASLVGSINGQCVAKAWDATFPRGEAGLVAIDGKAGFSGFSISEPEGRDEISVITADASGRTRPGATHGAFEPFIGTLWRPVAGRFALVDLDGEGCVKLKGGALRYYMVRPGDVRLSADLLQTDGKQVVLGICSDESAQVGYALSVTGGTLELLRCGEVVDTTALPTTDGTLKLEVRRDGPFIAAQAGGAVTSYRDPEPLPSGYSMVYAEGESLLDNIELGASHALAYRFDRVEPDWEPVSGQWMFHSGMACIPWAHWVSADGREEPAMSWNRIPAPANIAVSFDVSEYTVGRDSGEHYHYPYHDISLVVCAQEKSVDSGYRFVVGAEGGRLTRLYRNGELVQEVNDRRFTIAMGAHCNTPRAMEVAASKHGGKLRLSCNGVEALTYEDPEPLGDGWVGIGAAGCRTNFRDLILHRDATWEEPVGVVSFSPN